MLLGVGLLRGRGVGEGVGAERRLDLLAHRRERRVGLGGDQRRDDVERPQERLGLERREPGGPAERVAVELLVDVDVAVLGRAVDGVAAAAEVDEVQQVEALLELLRREPEPALELVGLDAGGGRVAAAGEQEGQERLEEREPLGRDRARAHAAAAGLAACPRRRPGPPAPRAARRVWASMTVRRSAATASTTASGSTAWACPPSERIHAESAREVGVGRREAGRAVGQLLDLAVCAVAALDEPRGVGAHLDARPSRPPRPRASTAAGRGRRSR